ncbi:aureocin A53 family class IId bacteriocin (plasmid) [Paraclostridium ghonii]|nr:aureocin A53 family class IId bacteriocin [Paeniclostridium ghonii]MCM0165542.1 aureocin A53 family class IId bacteriocin [Paeniclostridium ghonii]
MWTAILDFVWNYGLKAVTWAWANRDMLLSLGVEVFDFIRKIFG